MTPQKTRFFGRKLIAGGVIGHVLMSLHLGDLPFSNSIFIVVAMLLLIIMDFDGLKIITGILVMFSFSGCMDPYNDDYGDPELMVYVDQYRIEAANRGVKLPDKSVLIFWEELDKKNGYCTYGEKYMRIKIDPDIYYRHDEYSRTIEATVFHELTHGYFDRDHVPTWKGVEPSLMAVPHNGRRYWLDGSMRDYYLDELFGLVEMKDLNYLGL